MRDRNSLRLVAVAAISAALSGGAALSTIAMTGGSPTALVRMAATEPMARVPQQAGRPFRYVLTDDHYDGVYFYAVATDPFATGQAHRLIDHAAYRYSHGGYGLLASAVSATRPAAVPVALLALNLAAMAAAAVAVGLVAALLGRSPWWGLLVGLNPGLIFAVTADTSEPVGLAFAAFGVLGWMHRRRTLGVFLLAFAVLCKEPFLIVPASLLGWELLAWIRERRGDRASMGLLLIPFALFAGWQIYLRTRFGVWPLQDARAGETLAVPFNGWFQATRGAIALTFDTIDRMQLGSASLPLLLSFGSLMVVATVKAAALRSPFSIMIVLFAALTFCLGALVIIYPKDLLRFASVPLVLLPTVFVRSEAAR